MNSTYFLDCVAGNLYGTKTTPALPTEYFIGLSTTAPEADGTNVHEPAAGTGYARVKLEGLSEPTGGVVTNTNRIDFAESTSPWGTMTHYVIYDSLIDGNLLEFGALPLSRTVETGTIMTIKPSYLKLSVEDKA